MILVTGGAGFIGSRLCAALAKAKRQVISFDDYSTGSRDNHIAGIEYRAGHTVDIADLVPEVPSLIYHLGEYSRVEQSFADRFHVDTSCVIGTAAVIEYWMLRRCKLVYAGSSTRFGDASSPYAEAKAANADKVLAFGERVHLPAAVTYFHNVYGPGERAGVSGTLIETFRQASARGEPLTVRAPGTQRRHFTHVDDIVDGLMRLSGQAVGPFEIGAAEGYSIIEVAAMFGGEVTMLPARDGNRSGSIPNTAAIRTLGWTQRHTLPAYIEAATRAAAA